MQPWEDEEGKSCAIDHGVEGKHPYDDDVDDDDDDEKEDGNVDDNDHASDRPMKACFPATASSGRMKLPMKLRKFNQNCLKKRLVIF